jgi:beta-N-acetylhexosaminidase
VVNGLLRDELGFKGLVITDDLGMGAITATRNSSEAAVMAIEAGVDMALMVGSPEQSVGVWKAMVEAANNGRISRAHISRAFDHIARVKAMVSPPHTFHEETILRLRDAIAELNQSLQNS